MIGGIMRVVEIDVVAIAIAAALAPVLLPAGDRTGVDGQHVAAGVIFIGSSLALAIGRIRA